MIKWIEIDKLFVDDRLHRPRAQAHVKRIAESYDGALAGTLKVLASVDGRFQVMDGAYRFEAMKLCGLRRVPCEVYEAVDDAPDPTAMRMFLRANARRNHA